MIKKPESFIDLLELQKKLDETVSEERSNGFKPRYRLLEDIVLSLDDEFQEFLRELPYEFNFKTWKQKEYKREKEVEELTDVLFFFLQMINHFTDRKLYSLRGSCDEIFNRKLVFTMPQLTADILLFKDNLWSGNYSDAFKIYLAIVEKRGVTKKELIEEYFKKWNINMKRINKDWSITSQN